MKKSPANALPLPEGIIKPEVMACEDCATMPELILSTVFGKRVRLNDFDRKWLSKLDITMDGALATYNCLKCMGFSDRSILKQPKILGKSEAEARATWKYLSKKGFRVSDNPTLLSILARSVKTIAPRIDYLVSLGVKPCQMLMYPRLVFKSIQSLKFRAGRLAIHGISSAIVSRRPDLLLQSAKAIDNKFTVFSKERVSTGKIESHLILLTLSPEVLRQRIANLKSLGLGAQMIGNNLNLLRVSEHNINSNYDLLIKIGVKHSRISKSPSVLASNNGNMRKCYLALMRAFSDPSASALGDEARLAARKQAQKIVRSNPNLLGMNPVTLESAQQQAYAMKIKPTPLLLSTCPQMKRKKIACIGRRLAGRENMSGMGDAERKEALGKAMELVKKWPNILTYSKKAYETQGSRPGKFLAKNAPAIARNC
ncbi:MAG: hypothetical protein WC506_00515 [Candidatus Micrarchaeia archaeon]